MSKVFSPPKSITVPAFDIRDIKGSQEKEKQFIDQVKAWCKGHSKDKENASYVGEVFRIPMADGNALYAVYSLKPVELIHLPVGDAWDSKWANRANAKEIRQQIDGAKHIEKLFALKNESPSTII